MSVSPRTGRASALALLALLGCSEDGGGGAGDVAAAADADTGSPVVGTQLDTGVDVEEDEVVPLRVPTRLRTELREEGTVRVMVEMANLPLPELTRLPAVERMTLLGERAEMYAETRTGILASLAAEGLDAEVGQSYKHVPLVALDITDGAVLDRLARDPRVIGLHVDQAWETFDDQSLPLINQPEAVALGHTGEGTAVAILDTGLDYRHSDFNSCSAVGTPSDCRVVHVQDFAGADGTLDDNGHGTNVAAIVGNVAPGTDLLGLDVFRSNGYAYTSEVVAAIDWVVDNKDTYNIVALNMSLGGGSYTAECGGTTYEVAIAAALEAGVLSAVATGNNAWTNKIASPACAPSAVKVGAVYDSNIGGIRWSGCTDNTTAADKVTCFSNSTNFIDLLAPGAMIQAGGYSMGGTSQATPHVAGAMAVVAAAYPNDTPAEWLATLKQTGTELTDHRNGVRTPRIDLEAAVADADLCTVTLDPSSVSVGAGSDSGVVTVTAPNGCDWSAEGGESWLSLSNASGTGTGSFAWSVTQNNGDSRSASVSVNNASFAVSQSGNGAPTGQLLIDSGEQYTRSRTVSLSIQGTDDGQVTEMCLANVDTGSASGCSDWRAFSSVSAWTLSAGDGVKRVGLWVRDNYGTESSVVLDEITLDSSAPDGVALTGRGTDGGAVLSWSGVTDALSGVANFSVRSASGRTAPTCAGGTAVYSGTGSATTVSGLANDRPVSFTLCATDRAGNEASSSLTVVPSASAGGAGSVIIEGGEQWTRTSAVDLALTAPSASMTAMCVSNADSCTEWQAPADTLRWNLEPGEGSRTVTVWYRDADGRVSDSASDAISVDATRPTDGSLNVTGGDGQVALSWTGASDQRSGVAQTIVVMDPGTRPPASCSKGTEAFRGPGTGTTVTGLDNGSTYAFRACTVDAAGNVSRGLTGIATPRLEGPGPQGTIAIADGAVWVNSADVTIHVDSDDAERVCLSNNTRCRRYSPMAETFDFTLSRGDGEKVVYAQFYAGGVKSDFVTDSVQLDSTPPRDGALTVSRRDRAGTLLWDEATDGYSGVAGYVVVRADKTTEFPADCNSGTVVYEGTDTRLVQNGLRNSEPYAYRVCAKDVAGNLSRGQTVLLWPGTDRSAPTGTLTLNGGQAWTNKTTVPAVFSARDSGSGLRDHCIGTRPDCASWETYSASTTARLGRRMGEQTLYAHLRDKQGNVSEVITATVGYDSRPPNGGSVSAGSGNRSLSTTWGGFADAHSGVVSYIVGYREGSGRVRSCAQLTEAYTGSATSASISGLDNGQEYTVGVCAVDAAGNVSRPVTTVGRPASEHNAPTGSVTLAGGAAVTGDNVVDLAINASDASGVAEMCVSTNGQCRKWQPFAASSTVRLSNRSGNQTVSVWLKDGQGNVTDPMTDSILVDRTAPADGTLTVGTGSGRLPLQLDGFTDQHTSVAEYRVYTTPGSRAPRGCTGTPAWSGTSTSPTLTGLENGQELGIRVCAVDAVGNVSRGATALGRPASEYRAPIGSVAIENGAAYTGTPRATVNLSATDASGVEAMCVATRPGPCTRWRAFSPELGISLGGRTGTVTVYATFRDGQGNVSEPVSDDILLDRTAPRQGSVDATAGSGRVTLAMSGFSDAHSGFSGYRITQRAGGGNPPACGRNRDVYEGSDNSVALTGLDSGTVYAFRVCGEDNAGTLSRGVVVTATPR